MIKEYVRLLKNIFWFFDIGIILLSLFFFSYNKNSGEFIFKEYLIILLIWLIYLQNQRPNFILQHKCVYRSILITFLSSSLIFLLELLLWKIQIINTTPEFIFIHTYVTALMIVLFRGIVYFFFLKIRKNNSDNIIIVGNAPEIYDYYNALLNYRKLGINIVGILPLDIKIIDDSLRILGTLSEIDTIVEEYAIDEIYFIIALEKISAINDALNVCKTKGINAYICLDSINLNPANLKTTNFQGIPFLFLSMFSLNIWQLALKRTIDIVFSLLAIIVFLPIAGIIAISIKIGSKGPVFFVQKRVGRHGRIFPMLKYRTMVNDAEVLREKINYLNEQKGPVFKIKNDPRVTRVGRVLRKTSLDEIPQFINVLLGHMSLVGPRPPLPQEVRNYQPWQKRRLSIKPGITCIWQVSGRNDISFDEWMHLDLKYIDQWSLFLDLKLLLKTIPSVLFAKGNH